MNLYADQPGRRTRQILLDAVALLLVVLSVRVGLAVRETILAAAGPALLLETAGESLQGSLGTAAERVGEVPLLGSAIATPFEQAAAAGAGLGQAGAELGDTIAQTALLAGLAVALVPVVAVVIPWLLARLRFARNAAAVRALLATDGATDLLALRALATLPAPVLAKAGDDVAAGWREGRPDVVARLAGLELSRAGVAARRGWSRAGVRPGATAAQRKGPAADGEPLPDRTGQ